MKHIKSYMLGILIGVLITSIPVIASQVYNIYENEYPIKVNGEVVNIQGYNINDYSYFKLRDIGEFVGFNVDFKEDTIMIDTNTTTEASEISYSKADSVVTNNTLTSVNISSKTNDIVPIPDKGYMVDGIEYWHLMYFCSAYPDGKTKFGIKTTDGFVENISLLNIDTDEVIVDSVPYKYYVDESCICFEKEYLETVILPLDRQLGE